MHQITHWPDTATLDLPEEVSQDIHHRLLLPFASEAEAEAKEFWQEAPSTVIILDPAENLEDLHQDPVWNQLEFALAYPEYTVALSSGYQMLVAITYDSGGGIYLIVPPELSHITHREKA